MLPPVNSNHVARPFSAVLVSNVPGDYPPDQWADIIVPQIITVSANASDERKSKTSLFVNRIREVLIELFRAQQLYEQYRLKERGCDRYTDDFEIDDAVVDASGQIIAAAHEYLVFGSVDLGDYYAANRTQVCNTIGTNLATSVMITRKWHALDRGDDPRARRFLSQQH